MLVREAISFERKKDPKTTLGVNEKSELYRTRIIKSLEDLASENNLKNKEVQININTKELFSAGIVDDYKNYCYINYYRKRDKFYCNGGDLQQQSIESQTFDSVEECKDYLDVIIKEVKLWYKKHIVDEAAFYKNKDPKISLGIGERANLYRKSFQKIYKELKEEFPDNIGDATYPPPYKDEDNRNSFILRFHVIPKKLSEGSSMYSLHYTLPDDHSKEDVFLVTCLSSAKQPYNNAETFYDLEKLKETLREWVIKDIDSVIYNKKLSENMLVKEELNPKMSEEDICKLIDDYVADIEDHLTFYKELSGEEFIDEFNNQVREIFPQLTSDSRNFYKIYDKCRS